MAWFAALSGLGQFGSAMFQASQQEKQNNWQMDYMNSMYQNQYNNSLGLQENYQNWYQDFASNLQTQKFNESLEQMTYQAQLNGMNTPSALMAAHASTGITSSDPNNNLNRQLVGTGPLYSNFVQGETLNQTNQLNHGLTESELGVGRSSDEASTSASSITGDSASGDSIGVQSTSPSEAVDPHLARDNWLTSSFTNQGGKRVLNNSDQKNFGKDSTNQETISVKNPNIVQTQM